MDGAGTWLVLTPPLGARCAVLLSPSFHVLRMEITPASVRRSSEVINESVHFLSHTPRSLKQHSSVPSQFCRLEVHSQYHWLKINPVGRATLPPRLSGKPVPCLVQLRGLPAFLGWWQHHSGLASVLPFLCLVSFSSRICEISLCLCFVRMHVIAFWLRSFNSIVSFLMRGNTHRSWGD